MLADFVESITAFVQQIVLTFGAPGVTIIALLENLFPPTPSEFLYPLAGKMAYDGQTSLVLVILAGILGSLIGSTFYYTLGYRLGEERTRSWVVRFGTIRFSRYHIEIIPESTFTAAMNAFEKRGAAVIILSRIMPVIHAVVSIPAGVARVPFPRFVVYTIIGSALWIAPLAVLGWWLGSQWERVLEWLSVYESVMYVLIGALIVYWLYRRFTNRTKITETSESSDSTHV